MKARIVLVLTAIFFLGCGDDKVNVGSGPPPSRDRGAKQDELAEEESRPPAVDFQETAFVESERSRDPFRSYARSFVDEARGEVTSQREVILEQYSIEELRLVALIQRAEP